MEINGKVYRNLEGQVAYLTQYLESNALANEMGIKVLGRVDSVDDIPSGDYEYGDAYMVGEEGVTPYRMVIWSRDAGDGNPGWFDIGYFPTAPDEFSIVEVNGSPVHVFNADTKLDKKTETTTNAQVYAKNADGTQEMLDVVSGEYTANSVVRRDSGGRIKSANPVSWNDVVIKDYAEDNFLAKQKAASTYQQVYGKYTDGSQAMFNASVGQVGNNLVQRNSSGQVYVPDTPTEHDHAASKTYVDTNTTGKKYLHNLQLRFTITAGIYLVIIGRIINSSNSSITSIGYQEMLDLIVDYGAYDPGGTPNPASVTKCPNGFHQDDYDEPNIGFLAYYKSGGTFIQAYVDSTNALTVTDAVTQF